MARFSPAGRALAPVHYTQSQLTRSTIRVSAFGRVHTLKKLVSVLLVLPFFVPAFVSAQLIPSAPGPSTPQDRANALHALFHDYWEENLKQHPEFASTIGDKRYNDQIRDYSVKAINDWLAVEQDFLMKLAAIDPTGLSDQDKTSRELLLRRFTDDEEEADFKPWEMPVDQMGGIYSRYPDLATHLSFTTVKDYDDWIARLHQIPHAFEQVTNNMSIGIEDKRVPPKYLLEQTLNQVNQLADQQPEDSPLASPLKKFPASVSAAEQTRIRTEMLAAIGKEVLPAYKRFARFLQVSYIPAGRSEPGISSIPDGAKYYQFLIKQSTTTNLTPDQIHQMGLQEVAKDEAEMLEIAKKLGFKDLASLSESIKTNPKLKPTSPEALLAAYQGYVNGMEAKLPQLFGHLPQSKLEVVEMPKYIEKTAPPAYYDPGSPSAGRPGHLWVNLDNVPNRSLLNVEAIAYHEGVPGHHLQLSIAQEQQGVPEFRKHLEYTAFVEGWALYSEHLGKDAGFYQDPYSDFGRLDADMWRAIRLVVDTGVHSQHWTRQQMVDYFHAHSSLDEPTVQSEVDRYIAWPAQALAYKIGQMKILELRARAQKELGNKFDIRAFHDQVLDSGALPLGVLEERIDAWIASQKAK
jgi:uncharacterized protein (DUF885 family)